MYLTANNLHKDLHVHLISSFFSPDTFSFSFGILLNLDTREIENKIDVNKRYQLFNTITREKNNKKNSTHEIRHENDTYTM